jgi:glycosyltransferase involved in cell wall biosynthesis
MKLPFHVTPPEGPLKLRFILAAARIIRTQQIQIVHGHHGRDIWPTILAARLSGVRPKVVLTRHLAKSPSSWPSRRFLLGRVDALIACSHFVAQVLKKGHYEPHSPVEERRARPPLLGDHSKIQVIYGGIDTDRFKPMEASALRTEWGLEPEHCAFAMVGGYALPFGKGQREFLQASARIHAQVPNARFLIVGRGNMADLLQEDIRRLGLAGKAWLTPYCTDMPAAMNAIDCLVHSQIGTEAMPGVVCEALACGCPVIASDLDGVPEALAMAGEGRLVKPGNVSELAAAMTEQYTVKPPSESRQREMHSLVSEKFSTAMSARHHALFYRSLIG